MLRKILVSLVVAGLSVLVSAATIPAPTAATFGVHLASSADGSIIASTNEDGSIFFHSRVDIASSLDHSFELLNSFVYPFTSGVSGFSCFSLSSDGSVLVAGNNLDNFVTVYTRDPYSGLFSLSQSVTGAANAQLGLNCDVSGDGSYILVSHASIASVNTYVRANASSLFTLTSPGSLVHPSATQSSGFGSKVRICNKGQYAAIFESTTARIYVYRVAETPTTSKNSVVVTLNGDGLYSSSSGFGHAIDFDDECNSIIVSQPSTSSVYIYNRWVDTWHNLVMEHFQLDSLPNFGATVHWNVDSSSLLVSYGNGMTVADDLSLVLFEMTAPHGYSNQQLHTASITYLSDIASSFVDSQSVVRYAVDFTKQTKGIIVSRLNSSPSYVESRQVVPPVPTATPSPTATRTATPTPSTTQSSSSTSSPIPLSLPEEEKGLSDSEVTIISIVVPVGFVFISSVIGSVFFIHRRNKRRIGEAESGYSIEDLPAAPAPPGYEEDTKVSVEHNLDLDFNAEPTEFSSAPKRGYYIGDAHTRG